MVLVSLQIQYYYLKLALFKNNAITKKAINLTLGKEMRLQCLRLSTFLKNYQISTFFYILGPKNLISRFEITLQVENTGTNRDLFVQSFLCIFFLLNSDLKMTRTGFPPFFTLSAIKSANFVMPISSFTTSKCNEDFFLGRKNLIFFPAFFFRIFLFKVLFEPFFRTSFEVVKVMSKATSTTFLET